jgi:hypothetical protein
VETVCPKPSFRTLDKVRAFHLEEIATVRESILDAQILPNYIVKGLIACLQYDHAGDEEAVLLQEKIRSLGIQFLH